MLALACSDTSGGDAPEAVGEAVVGDGADDDGQSWLRSADDPARGVEVNLFADGTLTVFVSAAEFIRADPLESELRSAVDEAVRIVPGVDDVYEEDRELWVITGTPDPEQVLQSVGEAVDRLEPRIRTEIDEP